MKLYKYKYKYTIRRVVYTKNGHANPKTWGHTEIRELYHCKITNSSKILKAYFLLLMNTYLFYKN